MQNPQNIPPFKRGEVIKASALEGLRAGVAKRVRGLIGRSSSYSTATAQSTQRTRERIEILNNTGAVIPAFSLFAVKKSGTVNYPWGPPVRTEAFSFEAGLNYVTNYDYGIADTVAYPCLQVGSEPNLIRYNANDGVPKIGHPIGPLEDGSVSIKRCGYVVIAEPDTTNERVWIIKSNDQMIRVKLLEDIEVNCRGDANVISALVCSQPPPTQPPPIDILEDPNVNVPTGTEFTLREILNLTGRRVRIDEELFAEPTLGLGYVLRDNGVAIIGSIAFTMLTDRTREVVGGVTIGHAQVQITAIIGNVPDPVSATVTVAFVDQRWLESVAGCQGRADYIDGQYVVNHVQGLDQGFWFVTTQDRTAGAPQQDVTVTVPVLKTIGHANDDYSVDDWGGQPTGGGGQCSGSAVWTFNTQGQGGWQLTTPCGIGCTSLQNPNGLLFAPPPFTGDTFTSPCVDNGALPQGRQLKVRYLAGTFPRMLTGAIGYAQLDNDIENLTDNTTMRYYVVQSDQQTMAIGYYLTEDNCGVNFTLTEQQAPLGFVIHDAWPFSQAPKLPLNILNREHGLIDDYWAAKWNNTIGQYEVWYMQGHNVTVAINPRIVVDEQTNCKTIKIDTFEVNVHTCKRQVTVVSLGFDVAQVYTDLQLTYDSGDPSGDQSGDLCFAPSLKLKGKPRDVLACGPCDPSAGCVVETIGQPLPLTISTAYYRISQGVADSNGRKCIYLIPTGFVTFGDCEDGDPEELICANPCPEGSPSQ